MSFSLKYFNQGARSKNQQKNGLKKECIKISKKSRKWLKMEPKSHKKNNKIQQKWRSKTAPLKTTKNIENRCRYISNNQQTAAEGQRKSRNTMFSKKSQKCLKIYLKNAKKQQKSDRGTFLKISCGNGSQNVIKLPQNGPQRPPKIDQKSSKSSPWDVSVTPWGPSSPKSAPKSLPGL